MFWFNHQYILVSFSGNIPSVLLTHECVCQKIYFSAIDNKDPEKYYQTHQFIRPKLDI